MCTLSQALNKISFLLYNPALILYKLKHMELHVDMTDHL